MKHDIEKRIKIAVYEIRMLSNDLHFMKQMSAKDLETLEEAVKKIDMVVKLNQGPLIKGEENE